MTTDNKSKAVHFLTLASSGKVDEAFAEFVSPYFKHHNPYFEGSAEALQAAMKVNAKQNPAKIMEVKRAIAEADFVVTHSHIRQNPNDLGTVVVHIFGFENGKIVELWDLGQPIPEKSLNKNGIF